MSDPVPVAAGLFSEAAGELALLGTRCAGCATCLFPQGSRCPNPDCPGGELTPARIGRSGTLHSWTVQAYRPPPLFAVEEWAPYAIGQVEIPEGLRVLAIIDAAPEALAPELPLALVTHSLGRDPQGRTRLTYAYRPVAVTR